MAISFGITSAIDALKIAQGELTQFIQKYNHLDIKVLRTAEKDYLNTLDKGSCIETCFSRIFNNLESAGKGASFDILLELHSIMERIRFCERVIDNLKKLKES